MMNIIKYVFSSDYRYQIQRKKILTLALKMIVDGIHTHVCVAISYAAFNTRSKHGSRIRNEFERAFRPLHAGPRIPWAINKENRIAALEALILGDRKQIAAVCYQIACDFSNVYLKSLQEGSRAL